MDLLPTVKTPRTLVLLLMLTALLLMAMASESRSTSAREYPGQCRTIPGFRVNNVDPMALAIGHVILVALLSSSSTFYIREADRLQRRHRDLQNRGIDVYMMIVDGGPRPASGEDGVFENIVSFPVYHDDDNRTIWRQVFGGNEGDIFIIDRCGRETDRIPDFIGFLGLNYSFDPLARRLTRNICGNCDQNQTGSERP